MALRKLLGRGTIFNADGNPGKFSSFASCKLTWDTQTIEVPDDADFNASSFDLPLGEKATIVFSFNSIDADTWAMITGGTTTASESLHYVESEKITVPSAPGAYTVTLDNTGLLENDDATVVVSRVYAKDSDGDTTDLVQVTAASEVAATSYSIVAATGVLTFAAGDADAVYYVDYWYESTAGTSVTVEKNDRPLAFQFVGYLDAVSKGSTKQIGIKIPNVIPNKPSEWGADRLSLGGPFEITCGISSDEIKWYFNT
jgi:hypothetical protein